MNQFDDYARDPLDEWIYFLKNSEVKDEFRAKGLMEAKEVLDVMRLDKEAQYGYNRYLDSLHLKASEALSLKLEAEDKVKKEMVKNLIALGSDNDFIVQATGLSLERIEELRRELEH